ncbi:hypothetical protein [Nonlabens dokdonensis]|uniref:hypothetical protein n=1 Tax=Nonlabens dokdonensis TaxID=328515 RepID=UPI0026EAC439|nr:hypothetical protein [Nonlabens dokdonensis]
MGNKINTTTILKYLNTTSLKIERSTDFDGIKAFEMPHRDPLQIIMKQNSIYEPTGLKEFDSKINEIHLNYSFERNFIKDWLLYIYCAVLNDLEARLKYFISHISKEMEDIFDDNRKIIFLENKLLEIKRQNNNEKNESVRRNFNNYDFENFDITNLSIDELFEFINCEADILDDFLEIHADTLASIYYPPIMYYDEEFEIGSSNMESFLCDLSSYFNAIYLRECAKQRKSLDDNMDDIVLNQRDQDFVMSLGPILVSDSFKEIITEILATTNDRKPSFFSNLFQYFKKQTIIKPFFKDERPKEYIKIVSSNYDEIKFTRVTTHHETVSLTNYFEKTILKHLNDR